MLLGYGKMGKVIERLALEKGHTIAARIDADNRADLLPLTTEQVDVAIEFSQPDAVVPNLRFCLERRIPVVCGTTGWLEHKPAIEQLASQWGAAFFYASNYSIGVNLFFRLNKLLASWMNAYPQYEVSITEIHHTQKKDAPSGTAITLAEGLLDSLERKSAWVNHPSDTADEIAIHSLRESNVPGTHTVCYDSPVDRLEITHTAHNREGFAMGAVLAAEWLFSQAQAGRHGSFNMEDMLGNLATE